MKKLISLLLIIALLPLSVCAASFKAPGYKFELNKKEMKLTSPDMKLFLEMDSKGNSFYLDISKADSESLEGLVTIADINGKERTATAQEILNLLNIKRGYYRTVATGQKTEIYHVEYDQTKPAFTLTADTEIVSGKPYYKKEVKPATQERAEEPKLEARQVLDGVLVQRKETEEYEIVPVETPVASEIATYYEMVQYRYPSSTALDSNIVYYEMDSNQQILTKVAEPKANEILKYKVLSDGKETETLVKTLNNRKVSDLEPTLDYSSKQIIKLGNDNAYQFVFNMNNPSGEDTYTVYNEAGEEIYKGFEYYYPLGSVAALTYHGDTVAIYSNKDKIYSEKMDQLYYESISADGKTIYLSSINDEIYEFKIEVDPTTNPNTSDKFLIIAIIGLISILGFSKTTRRFKRKNALN